MTEYPDKFIEFWETYPNELAHKKKGIKQKAFEAWEKLKDHDEILRKTRELIRYDRHCLSLGEKPDRWPHASSYLNGGYYDREITFSDYPSIENVPSTDVM